MQFGDERGRIDEVIALAEAGNRSGARRLVLEIIQQNPDDVVALLWLAYTSERVEEVEVVLNRVLSLDPGNEKALEWQTLVRQKQERMRAGQTGTLSPLPPIPPAALPTRPYYQPQDTTPRLNSGSTQPYYIQPQPPITQSYIAPVSPTGNYTPQPYQPNQQPLAPWTPQTQYQVTVEPGPRSTPMLPYVQPHVAAPGKPKRHWWLVGLIGLILIGAIAALVFVLATPPKSTVALSDYRLFTNLDELVKDGFPNERIAVETKFMGGYNKDSQGTYLLTLTSESKTPIIVQWNEAVASMSNLRPGQFITIYGVWIGVSSGKGALRVEKVVNSSS